MRDRFFVASFPLLLLSLSCASPLQLEQKASAVPLAERWLSHLDSGEQELAWRELSSFTQRRYEKDVFLKLWFGAREPLGSVIKRSLDINWSTKADFIPNAPDGTYWEVSFQTDFEHRKNAIEHLELVWEDGQWRLFRFGTR